MALELSARDATGKTVYCQVTNSLGLVYNVLTAAFETPTAANWTATKYCIAMTEQSTTGIYEANMPALAAGVYGITAFEQAGGSPATTDTLIGGAQMQWDGTLEIALAKGQVRTTFPIVKNQALTAFPIYMVLSDHISPGTGKTVAVQRSIDGGAFAAATNTPATEVTVGLYNINLSAADVNGNNIVIRATAAGCDATIIQLTTQG